MKNLQNRCFSVFLLAVCLSITACEQEPTPTSFEGRVFTGELGMPQSGASLIIIGHRVIGFSNYPITVDTVLLGTDGDFSLVVPYKEELRFFTLNVLPDDSSDTVPLDLALTDCSPYSCASFQAGKSYKFNVKVSGGE